MQTRKDTLIRQKEIIRASRNLIVKYGSENITVRRIAQETGITPGAIYKHFKSKRELLSLLVDDIEITMISDIDNNISGTLKSFEDLEKIFTGHINAVEHRKGVDFQVIAEIISLGDKKLNKKISAVIKTYINRIKAIFEDGVKAGIIRSELNLEASARMFFCMTQGLVNLWALSHYEFNLVTEFKAVWDILTTSIRQAEIKNKSSIAV
jgi:AcrR family transcriptional regulator